MKDRLFELWEDDDYDGMISVVKLFLSQNESRYDEDADKVVKIKHHFKSDLPHRVVSEAVGCSTAVCRRYRWHGQDYGVVDTWHSTARKSISPSLRREVLSRDDWQCVRCLEEHDELVPHHIIPVSHGGVNHKTNLASLCPECHLESHGGDFSTRRVVYDGKTEFWRVFARQPEDVPL